MTKLKFPSPLGDYVFNPKVCDKREEGQQCFRPLSGIMFSIDKLAMWNDYAQEVSVPSRGLCFQSQRKHHLLTCIALKFPSPLGDYVFNRHG